MNDIELIAPYGGRLTDLVVADKDRAAWREKAASLPSIQISPRALCDLEMLSVSAFSPMDRLIGEKDSHAVLKDMRLADGTLFPIPLTLPVAETRGITRGKEIVLRGPTYEMLAIMRVDEIYDWSLEKEATAVLGTMDSGHPLVAEMYTWGRFYISGPLTVLNMPRHYDFPDLRMTPEKARARLRKWGGRTSLSISRGIPCTGSTNL